MSKELAKLEDTEVWVSTTNANMTTKLDVKKNRWVELEEDLHIKYYDETKINVFSFSMLFGLWKDMLGKDVIHIQYIFNVSTIIALAYAKLLSKPTVLSPRGALCDWCLKQGSKHKKFWLNWLLRPFVGQTIWHVTSEQEKNEVLAQFTNAKTILVPNGIDLSEFATYTEMTVPDYTSKFIGTSLAKCKIIVSMGRLQKKKGFDILIDSFALVVNKYPNSVLLIAGQDEGEKDPLEKQIDRLNLNKKVFLVGQVSGQNKIDFLANADLFALPSHNENFGNVYLESLASGTPIVASTGTPWSSVYDYKCGEWVENAIEETSEAMLRILALDKSEMKKNCLALAQEYSWQKIAKNFKLSVSERCR